MTLQLGNLASDPDGIGAKRAYMIWLWMTTLWDQTFARMPDGGSFQMGVIGTLGATALSTEMTTMSLEFPMLTVAKRVEINVNETSDFTCEGFYTSNSLLNSDDAKNLCANSTYFKFDNIFNTSVALTNMYMYQDVFNKKYFDDYTKTLGIDPTTMTDLLYGANKKFTLWFNAVNAQLYTHYH